MNTPSGTKDSGVKKGGLCPITAAPPYHIPSEGHKWRSSWKCGKCARFCKQSTFIARAGKWFCPSFLSEKR